MITTFILASMMQGTPALATILQRNTAAVGGATAIAAVQTRRVTAILRGAAPTDLAVVIEQQRPRLFRREVGAPGAAQVTVLHDDSAWRMEAGGKAEQLSPTERTDLFEDAVMDGDLVNSGAVVTLVSVDTLASGPAYHLQLEYPSHRLAMVWVDAHTDLEIRRTFSRQIMGRDVEMESTSGDYRKVGGISEPHRIVMKIPSLGVEMIMLMQDIQTNVAIPADRFKRP